MRVCTLTKKAALKAQNDAEVALGQAQDDAAAAAENAKEIGKELGRTKYAAERSDADKEDAYKKEDYKREREARAESKELWGVAEGLEGKLAAAKVMSKDEAEGVVEAKAAVSVCVVDVETAAKALTLTRIEAKDGWLAMADAAVACVETFCTDQPLVDARLKVNHGDAVGGASSFVQWRRQQVRFEATLFDHYDIIKDHSLDRSIENDLTLCWTHLGLFVADFWLNLSTA